MSTTHHMQKQDAFLVGGGWEKEIHNLNFDSVICMARASLLLDFCPHKFFSGCHKTNFSAITTSLNLCLETFYF